MIENDFEILKKELKKLQKKLRDKQEVINALTEHLQIKYEYSNRHINNIIESYRKKWEKTKDSLPQPKSHK